MKNELNITKKASKTTKQASKTRKLEQQLLEAQKMLEFTEKRLKTLIEQAEQDFLNSPTYHQMQQEIDFFKSLNKLNETHIANAKKQALTVTEHMQQIYADNKNICEHEGDLHYWIGITECWHEAKEYEKLKEEIRTLKSKVEQKDQSITERDAEIYRLQLEIGKMKCYRKDASLSFSEEQEEQNTLRVENDALRKQVATLEEQITSSPVTTTALSLDETIRIIERNIEQKKQTSAQKVGRPPLIDEQKLGLLIELRKKGHSVRSIAEELKMSIGNVHRYIKLYENSR